MSKETFPPLHDKLQRDKIRANMPSIKGILSGVWMTDASDWNEYMNAVREAEILALGVVRVTPVPQPSPPTQTKVLSFFHSL